MGYSDKELAAELLYGHIFLERFDSQLSALETDAEFVALVRSIHAEATNRYGGSIEKEKRFASNELFTSSAAKRFAPLGDIVAAVKADGYTISSALITVYFAMFLRGAIEPRKAAVNTDAAGRQSGGAAMPRNERDFRLQWPAEYRCEDGHYVRSKNEAIVDNWLYSHGICHAYEKAVFDRETGATLCSDFFVPERNLYIEVWGLSDARYEARRAEKVAIYEKLGCRLLGIYGDDVKNIDDVLSRGLL